VLLPCMYLVLEDVVLLTAGKRRTRTSERRRPGAEGEVLHVGAVDAPESGAVG
jgi:hypothetical protein